MKLLILGIGNVMYSDEGIGVHFVRTLERNFKFSSDAHEIKFLDGGTLANFLMHIIADYDEILLVDCIDADGEPQLCPNVATGRSSSSGSTARRTRSKCFKLYR